MIDRVALTRSRVVVLGLVAAAVVYKVLNVAGQGQSSLMFVGLPALLAVIVTFAPPSKSATGTIMKALTLMLLLAGILLIEGAVCILMAAPLVYGIGAAVGTTVDHSRNKREFVRVSLLVPLLLLSLQGEIPGTSGGRRIEASATRTVDMTSSEIERALRQPLDFERALPALFRFGRFPRPVVSTVSGDRHVIEFENGEPAHHKLARTSHAGHASSKLVLEIARSEPGRMVFETVSDTTMVSHWAALESSTIEWRTQGEHSVVRWTIRLERKLDPVWYFAPLQHYAAERTAAYLLDATFDR